MVFRVGQASAGMAGDPGAGTEQFDPRRSVDALLLSLEGGLSATQRRHLASLAEECDAELFGDGLLDLARRVERSENLESATFLYRWFDTEACPCPAGVRDRARRQLQAIEGRGEVGARAEFLLRRFTREASDPATIFAMGTAGALFRATRLATLAGLSANPEAGFLTRGFGARVLSSLAGFSVEATAFPFLGRLGRAAVGHSQAWTAADLSHEVGASFLTLGALKFCGWGAGAAFRRAHGLARGMPPGISQQAFQQAAMLGGILLGHGLESLAGLRQQQDGATTLVDSLAMLLQFNVAGSLTRRAFGSRFHAWERSVDRQSERLQVPSIRPPRNPFESPALALAAARPERTDPRSDNLSFMKGKSTAGAETLPFPLLGYEGPAQALANRPNITIEYPPELERSLSRLEERMRTPDYLEGSREDLRRKRPDEDLIDRLWFHQARDLLDRISWVRYAEVEDSIFFERMAGHEKEPNPHWVDRAREILGARGRAGSPALKVLEIRFPRKEFNEATFDSAEPEGNLSQLGGVAEMEKLFGGEIHFMDRLESGDRILRIPSLSFAEALLQAKAGPEAVQFHYVDGAIPRDQIMSLRSRRVTPVGISRGILWFGDTSNWIFPFPFSAHDSLFHGCIDSQAVPGKYLLSQAFYDWLSQHDPGNERSEGFLNSLADGDLGHGTALTEGTLGQNLRVYFEEAVPRAVAARDPARLRSLRSLLDSAKEHWIQEVVNGRSEAGIDQARLWRNLHEQVLEALRPPIEYPPEIEAAWAEVETAFLRPGYLKGNRTQMARQRPNRDAVDAIWLYQTEHFLQRTSGASSEYADADAILALNPPEQYPRAASILKKAYSILGERAAAGSVARRVLLMRPSNQPDSPLAEEWKPYLGSDLIPLSETYTALGEHIRLADISVDGAAVFPSLSLMEAMYQAVHGKRTQFHEVPGQVSRGTVMSLRRRGLSPVGLVRDWTVLEGLGNPLHPALFGGHDAYIHAAVDAQMPLHYKRTAGRLYDRLDQRLPPGRIREDFLDALSDLNVSRFQGFGAAMFLRFLERSVAGAPDHLQKAATPEEFRARAVEIEDSIRGIRQILGSFPSDPVLIRAQDGSREAIDLAERRVATARRIREETEAHGIPAPPLSYRNETLDVIDAIESHYRNPDYYAGSREDLRRRRVPLDLADHLWFEQAVDFASRIPGSNVQFLTAEEALLHPVEHNSNVEPNSKFDPDLIRSAIAALDSTASDRANQVLQMSLPLNMVGMLDQSPKLRFLAATPFLHDFEKALDYRISLWGAQGDRVLLRIPSLSLAEKLIQAAHGEDRGQLHFVPGVIPRDLVSSLHARRVSPVALVAAPQFFGEFREFDPNGVIHPFALAQHDAFEHAPRDAGIERGVPEAAHWLYDRIQRRFPDSALRERTLNALTDITSLSSGFEQLSHSFFDEAIRAQSEVYRLPLSAQKHLGYEAWAFSRASATLMAEEFDSHPELAAHRGFFEGRLQEAAEALSWAPARQLDADVFYRADYSPEFQGNWEAIQEHFGRRNHLSADPQWLERNRMPRDLADRHWFYQAEDYGRSLPDAKVHVGDLDLLHRSVARGSDAAELLRRAEAALDNPADPLSRRVLEIELPALIEEDMAFETTRYLALRTLAEVEIRSGLGIPFAERSGDSVRFRIPSLSFYENLLKAKHGAHRANFHFVQGTIAQQHAMGLRGQRRTPVGLARNLIFLDDFEELGHPFNYTSHDVLIHATEESALPDAFLQLAPRFYRFVDRRFPQHPHADRLKAAYSDLDSEVIRLGGINLSFRDSIDLLREGHQQAQDLEGAERRREMAELDQLSAGLHAWIRQGLPRQARLSQESLDALSRLMELRRQLRQEARSQSRSGRQ